RGGASSGTRRGAPGNRRAETLRSSPGRRPGTPSRGRALPSARADPSWPLGLAHLEDSGPHRLLDARVAHPEEAHPVARVHLVPGLEPAADAVDPDRIVAQRRPARGVDVDRLVLPARQLAAVVPGARDPAQ